MGGRGTYASGNANTPFRYKSVGRFHGIKVLEGIGSLNKLPEESHSSMAYAKLLDDGNLQMLRFYDKDKYLVLEIGYHPEFKLTGHFKPVYHIHEYTRNFTRTKARLLRADEIEKYKKFLTVEGHLQ